MERRTRKTGFCLLPLLLGVFTVAMAAPPLSSSGCTGASAAAWTTQLFAPDGEHLFTVQGDGLVQKRALPHLSPVAGVALNEPIRGAALSHDGRFLALGAPQSRRLLILDATDLQLIKQIPVQPTRESTARVAQIGSIAARNAFLVTFSDAPQLWEVNYQTPPPAGFGNWVHDYRKDSGEAKTTAFPVRKLWLETVLPRFRLDPEGVFVSGVNPRGELVLFDLDLGRTTAIIPAAPTASREADCETDAPVIHFVHPCRKSSETLQNDNR